MGTTDALISGYVALAVANENGSTLSTELDTGHGGDREKNMIAFAVKALELVKEVIERSGEAKM